MPAIAPRIDPLLSNDEDAWQAENCVRPGAPKRGVSSGPLQSSPTARRRQRGSVTVNNTGWTNLDFKHVNHVLLTDETGKNEASLISHKPSRDWWAVLFTSNSTGRIYPNWRPFVITIIATTLVIVLDLFAFQIRNTNIEAGIAGLTFVVGLLMSFRITDAYKSWYEARSAWQSITGNVSGLYQLVWATSDESESDSFTVKYRLKMYTLLLAFPVVLKNSLRGSSNQNDAKDLEFILQGTPSAAELIPLIVGVQPSLRLRRITLLLRFEIEQAFRKGVVPDSTMQILQQSVSPLESLAGTCGLIKGTPFVFGVAVHYRTVLLLYMCSLPLVLLSNGLEIQAIYLFMVLLSFALLTLDEVAVRLEQPFGFDTTDLPLGEYCNIMKTELDMVKNSDLGDAMASLDKNLDNPLRRADLHTVVSVLQVDKAAYLPTHHSYRIEAESERVAQRRSVKAARSPLRLSPVHVPDPE